MHLEEPAGREMGLLEPSEWAGAQWIASALVGEPRTGSPAPFLRRGFALEGAVAHARLYVTALGVYEFYLNGQRMGDDVFRPGWTEYGKRVQVRRDRPPAARPERRRGHLG